MSSEKRKFELYDLQSDPREEKNLASENAELLRRMYYELRKSASREVLVDKKTGEPLLDRLKSLGYLQ